MRSWHIERARPQLVTHGVQNALTRGRVPLQAPSITLQWKISPDSEVIDAVGRVRRQAMASMLCVNMAIWLRYKLKGGRRRW